MQQLAARFKGIASGLEGQLSDLGPCWGDDATGEEFFNYLKDAFDLLYAEGERVPKMMSVGLHCRLSGRPGRAAGLARFLDYIAARERVWIARRLDIAQHWHREHRALAAGAPTIA